MRKVLIVGETRTGKTTEAQRLVANIDKGKVIIQAKKDGYSYTPKQIKQVEAIVIETDESVDKLSISQLKYLVENLPKLQLLIVTALESINKEVLHSRLGDYFDTLILKSPINNSDENEKPVRKLIYGEVGSGKTYELSEELRKYDGKSILVVGKDISKFKGYLDDSIKQSNYIDYYRTNATLSDRFLIEYRCMEDCMSVTFLSTLDVLIIDSDCLVSDLADDELKYILNSIASYTDVYVSAIGTPRDVIPKVFTSGKYLMRR